MGEGLKWLASVAGRVSRNAQPLDGPIVLKKQGFLRISLSAIFYNRVACWSGKSDSFFEIVEGIYMVH